MSGLVDKLSHTRGPGGLNYLAMLPDFTNNWDLAVSKRFPIFGERRRFVQFRTEMFNAFNHTQFSDVNSTARFDKNGVQVDPTFGQYTKAFKPRNIQLSLKLVF